MDKSSSCKFEVLRTGVKYYHAPDFCLHRSHGSGDYIFIKFLNKATIEFLGQKHIAEPGNCIFFSPKCAHRLSGYNDEGLANDWLHFKGQNGRKIMAKYNLPINTVIPTVNVSFVRGIINNIKKEISEIQIPHSNRMNEILFETLCINLARSLESEHEFRLSSSKREHFDNFRKLRRKMLETFCEDWTVEKMATEVYMSSSRFAVLYKEFFGTSPIAELLEVRISNAKWLLTSTTCSVKSIARQSGFKNVYYFSRKFNEYVGCPPTKYYTNYVKNVDD